MPEKLRVVTGKFADTLFGAYKTLFVELLSRYIAQQTHWDWRMYAQDCISSATEAQNRAGL